MSIQPASLFSPRWDIFWATTYSFELELFDEYLFRRLGEPPLNATVLVDFTSLTKTWSAIQPGEEWRVQRVNRLYLVRSAGAPQGRFHPKTYFFANSKDGVLLVGSGNLSMSGLEEGHEVFCRFDSSNPEGLAAILTWREWIQTLVEQSEDKILQQRWIRLRQTTREWFKGPAKASGFVTNLETSLLDQFVAGVSRPADELHATAPFFDRDAEAFDTMLRLTRPKSVFVYLGRSANVDGSALRMSLQRSRAKATVYSFDPPRFVHAKLAALVLGKRARVLSGSANLSRAALTSNLKDHSWANVEAGVIAETTPATARELFRPPGLTLQARPLEYLRDFSFEDPEPALEVPIRLLSVRPAEDGTMEIARSGKSIEPLFLTSPTTSVLVESSHTVKPFPLGRSDILVWLTDKKGEAVSNRVPVDDPQQLQRQLEASTSRTSERPRELDAADMESPIGRILVRLHNEFIFDLDELEAVKQAERANEDETAQTEPGDFWERLAREALQVDPRAGAYRRFGGQTPFEDDDVLLLLRMMLDRTPEQRHALIGGGEVADVYGETTKGIPWTPSQRLQVRLMNLFTRWTRALADPSMNWLQPFASVRNFQALLYALAELHELQALPEDKLKRLTGLLLGNFVRSEEADGYLVHLSEAEREEALKRLSPEACAVTTALTYLGLQPRSSWQENIFEWQVWIGPALDLGLVNPSEAAAGLVSRVRGEATKVTDLTARLDWARNYIDDPRWCLKMGRVCGLEEVQFSKQRFAYELVLEVVAPRDLIGHPGIVKLIRSALDFRRADGIVIMAGRERIAVRLGDHAFARLRDGKVRETPEAITNESLASLEEAGLSLGEVFARATASAGSAS